MRIGKSEKSNNNTMSPIQKNEGLETVGDLSNIRPQIVLYFLFFFEHSSAGLTSFGLGITWLELPPIKIKSLANTCQIDFSDSFHKWLQTALSYWKLRTPHLTRRIFSSIYTHMRGSSRVFVVRASCVILMCLFWLSLRLLHFPLFADHLLSYHLVLPPAHQLHLPRCGGQIPCAHSLMRSLALLPSTTFSQVVSPTTTKSRRLLNRTSRNPRLRMGPRMTSTTMTSPSARRSLMRAVDEPITLKTQVCRPVSRRLLVIEQGDPL